MLNLVFLSGMPGTGKTTLSNQIIKVIKHSVLVRRNSIKEWIGDFGHNKTLESMIWEDRLVYEIMLSMAFVAFKNNYSVIVDGAGWKKAYYDRFEKLARKQGARMFSVRLKCRLVQSEHRTAKRKQEYKWNISKLLNYQKMFEEIPVDLSLNTDIDSPGKCLEKVMKKISIK